MMNARKNKNNKTTDQTTEEIDMNTRFNFLPLAVIVGLLALLLAGVGITGVAAQAAIPGDALYTVKTGIEQTRLSLASDAGQRAQMKMAFAEQRLNEISALIEEGRYREINDAVLAFESGINGAILELQTLSQVDPARSARLAQDITRTLTRYAQTLSGLVASAPEDVRGEVKRALTSTHTASSLDLPDGSLDDNGNSNANDNSSIDDHGNDNSADDNSNASINDNGDDHGNDNSADDNSNASINDNGDDHGNDNSADDNSNTSINDNGDDHGNDNSADDNSNASINDNGDDNGNDNSADDNSNSSINDNGNDNGNDNSANDNGNANGNSNDDSGSGNDNGGNDNGGDHSGKGGG
jgi:hypothetical protein